jgi:hypothetical protein
MQLMNNRDILLQKKINGQFNRERKTPRAAPHTCGIVDESLTTGSYSDLWV